MNLKKVSIFVVLVLVAIVVIIPTAIVTPFIGAGTNEDYQLENATAEDLPDKKKAEEDSYVVSVFRSQEQSVDDVPLEQYVAGVVASEMPAEFELEALKAQSLAARTYIVKYVLNEEGDEKQDPITDTVQHQVYKSEEELKKIWGGDFSWKMEKIKKAVAATKGQIITYKEQPITPSFFSTSNGYTENAEDYWQNPVPYLVSVESPWDQQSPKFRDQKIVTISEAEKALGINFDSNPVLGEIKRTSSNRVETMNIAGKQFTGREIREALKLQSSDFKVEQKNQHLIFTTKGNGHGVGMSQYGANGMAKEGHSYKDIIKHYYKDTSISKIKSNAERVTVLKN
ncbi:stage II sporulation protein D [Salinibacillus kushneri]|uniref:Stage II sporulation protein D n=1 Tax=Salinibacillus kushneri TaxID=237682 RepID=A0A1I0CZV0_9BACI|nr:stage II sporulation protein D [Salinibacillus kushneri]SET25014.1 stage II sporulation protein D [Salinibacillus kushneri]